MKYVLATALLFSSVAFANTVLTIETKYENGKALITATNVSGIDLDCKYNVKWRTSFLDHRVSWGSVLLPNTESVTVIVEDEHGRAVKKATPNFACDEF